MEDTSYDPQTLEALESFHRVWSRVAIPSASPPAAEPLTELISRLSFLHRHYAALTAHSTGNDRAELHRIARETSRHFRRLMAEHYIRDGKLFTPELQPLPKGKRQLLRSAILQEDSLTSLCGSIRDTDFYHELSAASAARKETAKKLLIACF